MGRDASSLKLEHRKEYGRVAEIFQALSEEHPVKTLAFILLAALTACSTPSHHVLTAEYLHSPPSLAVLRRSLRVGMSSDEFARLFGVLEPAWISSMCSHYSLPDGGWLTTEHDSSGNLLSWDMP